MQISPVFYVLLNYCPDYIQLFDLTLFLNDSETFNTDINECSTGGCEANADCTNTVGSFSCSCKSGYHGDGKACDIYRKLKVVIGV